MLQCDFLAKQVPNKLKNTTSIKPIPFKITQKDLGILVSESLKWSSHINNLISKANKMLGFVRRICFYLANVNCRRLLYLTLVRSQFSHGSEVWAPQGPSSDLLRLESVQRRATKVILQDYKSSYSDRLKKLKLFPISYWLEIKDIVFYYINAKRGCMILTLISTSKDLVIGRPVPVLVTFCVQIYVEQLSSGTRTSIVILNLLLPYTSLKLNYMNITLIN